MYTSVSNVNRFLKENHSQKKKIKAFSIGPKTTAALHYHGISDVVEAYECSYCLLYTSAPAAMYLAAAGVGTIGIVDADEVDLSNLQRQIIHGTADVGKAKVKSAKETMNAMNPDVEVKTYRMFVDSSNIRELVREYDFIIDGTDNLSLIHISLWRIA